MYVLLTTGHFDWRVVKVTRAHPELKRSLAKVPARNREAEHIKRTGTNCRATETFNVRRFQVPSATGE